MVGLSRVTAAGLTAVRSLGRQGEPDAHRSVRRRRHDHLRAALATASFHAVTWGNA